MDELKNGNDRFPFEVFYGEDFLDTTYSVEEFLTPMYEAALKQDAVSTKPGDGLPPIKVALDMLSKEPVWTVTLTGREIAERHAANPDGVRADDPRKFSVRHYLRPFLDKLAESYGDPPSES